MLIHFGFFFFCSIGRGDRNNAGKGVMGPPGKPGTPGQIGPQGKRKPMVTDKKRFQCWKIWWIS